MSEAQTKLVTRIHIRWMVRRDLPEVLAIDAASFPRPWGERGFLSMPRRLSAIRMVAESGGRVVGFYVYELHGAYLHLRRMAVHPDCRRSRVGTQVVAHLAAKLSIGRRTSMRLLVRESNVAAQLFLRANGFEATAINRGHYEATGDDAYVMEYRVGEEGGLDEHADHRSGGTSHATDIHRHP